MMTKEQADQRISELYNTISTSRAGVAEAQRELDNLIKMKFDNQVNRIFENTETRGLLQG